MPNRSYRRATKLMEADVGHEMVALDEKAGTCFGFNTVAADVWRSLASPKSFDELRDELLIRYDVTTDQCTGELQELLDDMVAKRLIDEVR